MVGEDFIESKNESNIFNFPISDSVKISDTQYMSIMLTWAVANFSIFAFDILALLEGKYRQGYISSNYGMSWLRSNSK